MSKKETAEENRMKILDAVIVYFQEHGYAPSYGDICDMTGLKSRSTVCHHIELMLKDGILETDSKIGTPRAIRVPGYKFIHLLEIEAKEQDLRKE